MNLAFEYGYPPSLLISAYTGYQHIEKTAFAMLSNPCGILKIGLDKFINQNFKLEFNNDGDRCVQLPTLII